LPVYAPCAPVRLRTLLRATRRPFPLTPTPPRPTLFPYTTLFRSREKFKPLGGPDGANGGDGGNVILEVDPQTTTLLPYHRSPHRDRKSTRLNSSHLKISYAVFCLKQTTPVSGSISSRALPRHPIN